MMRQDLKTDNRNRVRGLVSFCTCLMDNTVPIKLAWSSGVRERLGSILLSVVTIFKA